jgi:hypothetical protein
MIEVRPETRATERRKYTSASGSASLANLDCMPELDAEQAMRFRRRFRCIEERTAPLMIEVRPETRGRVNWSAAQPDQRVRFADDLRPGLRKASAVAGGQSRS